MNTGINRTEGFDMNQPIRINKYMPVALLYFFFNGFLLPLGLLYTTLLTPLFLIWLFKFPEFKYLGLYFVALTPFLLVHLLNGVDAFNYEKSALLLLAIYIFTLAFYRFLQECKTLRTIYRKILIINIFFVACALLILFIPSLTPRIWYTNDITAGVFRLKRLKMLTYEPSYYSILFAPLALYYYLKAIVLKLPDRTTTLLLLSIPLLLSLSFGVILGLALSLGLTLLTGFRNFFPGNQVTARILFAGIILIFLLSFCWVLFPNNIFFLRISNVLAGQDTSFKGRTFDSFYLGWKIAEVKSIYFGVGPGQVKLIGLNFFKAFYNNSTFTTEDIGIPNSVADTLATFGLFGVALRLGLEVWLFFRTGVRYNYYRLGLFLFIFIYQFTGSYIMNIAEYVCWAMAFKEGIFEEFDKKNFILPRQARNS